MNSNEFATLIKTILDGDQDNALREVEKLISQKVSTEEIVTQGIEKAMEQLDNRCTAEQYNLLELMLAGRAVNAITTVLFPDGRDPEKSKAKVIVATLEGDVHDLGKNIVKKALMGHNYYVIDCGKDSAIEKIINTARRENAIAICISGLITSVIPVVKKLKPLLKDKKLGNICLLAGGAALKQSSSSELLVDYVGETAFDAIHYIEKLIKEKHHE